LFIGLVITGLFFLFMPKWHKYLSLQETRNTMVDQNNAKAEEIKEFKIKQERFTSEPAFVERTARETGMVTSDEVVYKFKDANGKVPAGN
jgi:cell division protein FtsB